jgi:hypothetical protein
MHLVGRRRPDIQSLIDSKHVSIAAGRTAAGRR